MGKTALAALLVAGLGCVSPGPVPPDRFYRLAVPVDGGAAPTRLEGSVEVERFTADGLLRERSIVWSEAGKPLELRQHDYHYWAEAPIDMLSNELARYLRERGVAPQVLGHETRQRPDYSVSGRVRRFERVLGGGAPAVAVELRLALRDEGAGTVVWGNAYRGTAEAGGDSVPDAVAAMNRLAGELFGQFVADLAAFER